MERKTRRSLALPVSLQVGIVYIKRSANHDYISVSNTFVQLIEVKTTSRLTYLFNTPIHAVQYRTILFQTFNAPILGKDLRV